MDEVHGWQGISRRLGGVCRSKVFELWGTGELGSITIGRRRFSTDGQIEEYIARRLEAAASQITAGGAA